MHHLLQYARVSLSQEKEIQTPSIMCNRNVNQKKIESEDHVTNQVEPEKLRGTGGNIGD